MLPAHQGFHAAQHAGSGIHAGLEVDHELVLLDGLAQRLLAVDARMQTGGKGRFVKKILRFTLFLCHMHCQVGML